RMCAPLWVLRNGHPRLIIVPSCFRQMCLDPVEVMLIFHTDMLMDDPQSIGIVVSATGCAKLHCRCAKQLFVPAVAPDQRSEVVPARPSAFWTLDAQHVELADQATEDDRAIAGHDR